MRLGKIFVLLPVETVRKTYFNGVKDDQLFQHTHEAFTDAGFGQATHVLARYTVQYNFF